MHEIWDSLICPLLANADMPPGFSSVANDPKRPLKGWGVWEDHQARDRRDASTLDILATPQFRKRAQKSDRDDGQNELRNDSR